MAEQGTSPAKVETPASPRPASNAASPNAPNVQEIEPLPLDGEDLEPESDFGDSAYGSSVHSDSTSLRSSIISGLVENGRRYQVTRDNDVNIPSDESQFLSMEAGHQAYTIIECQQENPYFRSPISQNAQHILDLGTGAGGWAVGVADRFPKITVHGVDLYPPPTNWVPPNCILEVDDFTKPWTWHQKFDLVHLRMLIAALPTNEWKRLYRRAYHNLAPGGWIEHVDLAAPIHCDDGSLPKDSLLAGYGELTAACVAQTENAINVTDIMRAGIENAGFINVHERYFKFPLGDWPKHPVYKEAGAKNVTQFKEGLQGWVMWALTKYGAPTPWSPEEVQTYVAKMRQELDQKYHIYQWNRRVWAQKPYDAVPKSEQQPLPENVAPAAA